MASPHHAGARTDPRTELDIVTSGNLSMLVVFFYDYLLTLSREVELIWQGSFQFTTVLYFMARYLPFFGLVYFIAAESTGAKQTYCTPVLRLIDALSILARGAITVVLVAQTYAMYNQCRLVLVTLSCLGLSIIVVDGFEVAADTCDSNASDNLAQRATVALAMLTAFSTAVMGLTLYKLMEMIRQKRSFRQCIQAASLTRLIFFEGLSMSAVCLFRLFDILLLVLSPTAFKPGAKPIMLPIAAIVISHFLLNLRNMHDQHPNEHTDSTTTKSLAFTTVRLNTQDQRTSCHSEDPEPVRDSGTFEIQQEGIISGSDPREDIEMRRTFDSEEDPTVFETWRHCGSGNEAV